MLTRETDEEVARRIAAEREPTDETQPLKLVPVELGPRTLHALITCHLAAVNGLSPHDHERAAAGAVVHAKNASALIKASREAFEAEE